MPEDELHSTDDVEVPVDLKPIAREIFIENLGPKTRQNWTFPRKHLTTGSRAVQLPCPPEQMPIGVGLGHKVEIIRSELPDP